MATMTDLRQQLADLRKSLAAQKAGLSRWAAQAEKQENKEWFEYAIKSSDKVRRKIAKVISTLDDVIGS